MRMKIVNNPKLRRSIANYKLLNRLDKSKIKKLKDISQGILPSLVYRNQDYSKKNEGWEINKFEF